MGRCFLRKGLWLRRDWLWSVTDPDTGSAQWSVMPRGFEAIVPVNSRLWLRPRGRDVPSGWYLFVIRHRGNNPRVTGLLRSGVWGFAQARPMYPIRLRFRVVRLNRKRPLTLELQRVSEPMQICRLWLLRLPAWDAWRRIQRRLRRLDHYVPPLPAACWRYYNQLLCSQGCQRPLISYSRWQQQLERPFLQATQALRDEELKLFDIQIAPKLSPVNNERWVVMLRPGVTTAPCAFAALALYLLRAESSNESVVIYGDEDLITSNGERHSPRFKPAWNQELFWADPEYSNHWIVQGRTWNDLLETLPQEPIGWWELQYRLLQVVQRQGGGLRIRHWPMVLTHGYQPAPANPAPFLQSQLIRDLGEKAPTVHLAKHGLRIEWACPQQSLLSVMIPTRDHLSLLKDCLRSIEDVSAGVDLELIVIDNGSVDPSMLAFLESFGKEPFQQVLRDAGAFNFSALNNRAAMLGRGSVLLLLNNDVELISPDWGRELVANALRPGIGCVGAQLHYPDRTIQHGGVVLGIGGMASHGHRDFSVDSPGYQGRLQLAQEFSAVTAACLAISRENWQKLDGLDDKELAVNYNDVDLCLRAQSAGLRNLYLPHVQAIHYESKSRGRPEGEAYRQWRREWDVMERRWGHLLENDSAYHPCLTLEDERWGLSLRQPSLELR